jgi:restriction system protein
MARKRGFFAELEHQRMQRARAEQRFHAEQQRLAKQALREQERTQQARKRAAAQATREQQAQHAQQRLAEAAELTKAVNGRVAELETVLVTALAQRASPSLDQLRQRYRPIPFVPDPALSTSAQPPHWPQYAPPQPSGLSKVFTKSKYESALQEAQQRFAQAMSHYQAHEKDRLGRLAAAEYRHNQSETSRRQEIEQNNAQVDLLEQAVVARVPQAVEDYFELLLEASPLAADLPVDVETAYQPEAGKLLIIRELPGVDAIPDAREYTYVRARDEIITKVRPVKEVKQRYADLVAQLVLRTMRDVLEVQPAGIVDEVAVNGHVSTRNKATGQPERPCLVSVSATREQFAQFVLDELDPAECLRHLNALVSPHPWDLEPVRPIFDPDLSKYRFVDAHDAAAGLDARPVLLEMHPIEFEHLVRQLFEAMGMKSWVTQASRDDGIDAVAVNEDPIMGGVCIVQAKRYSKVVPAEAVRALAGSMEDKRASRGVLVTTSWFGKATHDFKARHGRIQLIEGQELVHLLSEHLNLEVLIGQVKHR